MKRKPYNKITVTDLVQEAGVSAIPFTEIIKAPKKSSVNFWRKKLLSGGANLLLIQTVILTLFLKCSITFWI